jgi:hypothetical protein
MLHRGITAIVSELIRSRHVRTGSSALIAQSTLIAQKAH